MRPPNTQVARYSARDSADNDDALRLLGASCVAPETLTLKPGAQVVLIKTLDAAQAQTRLLCYTILYYYCDQPRAPSTPRPIRSVPPPPLTPLPPPPPQGLVNGARGLVIKLSSLKLPLVRFDSGVEQIVRRT